MMPAAARNRIAGCWSYLYAGSGAGS
jgi:hypothetical protein